MRSSAFVIRTPEGIVFSQALAGPASRFVAWLVDLLLVVALSSALYQFTRLLGLGSVDVASAVFTVGYFAISIGYGIVMEWNWRGQTIGKRLLRLRVVDAEGLRLEFDQILTRNLLRAVDMLPAVYFVGGLVCWFNRKSQRVGDIVANTVVVRTPAVAEPDLDQILAGKFNSLRHYPHLAARLRQRVSPGEASAALQALIRRDQFEPAARVDLFRQLAEHFRTKVDFPSEATDGIADEQYIRNVVDVLYRSRA